MPPVDGSRTRRWSGRRRRRAPSQRPPTRPPRTAAPARARAAVRHEQQGRHHEHGGEQQREVRAVERGGDVRGERRPAGDLGGRPSGSPAVADPTSPGRPPRSAPAPRCRRPSSAARRPAPWSRPARPPGRHPSALGDRHQLSGQLLQRCRVRRLEAPRAPDDDERRRRVGPGQLLRELGHPHRLRAGGKAGADAVPAVGGGGERQQPDHDQQTQHHGGPGAAPSDGAWRTVS